MKVETTNLTLPPFCLAVIRVLTQEIVVQVGDRNLYTTNRQNDREARRKSYPDGGVIETRSYHFLSARELYSAHLTATGTPAISR